MTPEEIIGTLDRLLEKNGEDAVLRRIAGTRNQSVSDVAVRASVRDITSQDLITGGNLSQDQLGVTISPTQIDAAGWPGGTPPGFVGDPRIPLKATDKMVIRGKVRAINDVNAKLRNGVLVRIDLIVEGG